MSKRIIAAIEKAAGIKGNSQKKKTDALKNKQKVLIFATRGITTSYRHLMDDLRMLIPHCKKDNKLDTKDKLNLINEICEMKRYYSHSNEQL